MYLIDKRNKLWYIDGGSTFITFAKELVEYYDEEAVSYISDHRKHRGEKEIIQFHRGFKHFKHDCDMRNTAIKMSDLIFVPLANRKNINQEPDFSCYKNIAIRISTLSGSNMYDYMFKINKCIDISSDNYIIIKIYDYVHIAKNFYDVSYREYVVYYIDKKSSYDGKLTIYIKKYYFPNCNFEPEINDSENVVEVPFDKYYYVSNGYITDDTKYFSLIDEIYPSVMGAIGRKNDKYYLNGSMIRLNPELTL